MANVLCMDLKTLANLGFCMHGAWPNSFGDSFWSNHGYVVGYLNFERFWQEIKYVHLSFTWFSVLK